MCYPYAMDSPESTANLKPAAAADTTNLGPYYVITIKGVVSHEERVLLLRKPNGRWDLPGGKLEPGEGVIDGLRREIAEETGLQVDVDRIVDSWVRGRQVRPSKFVVTYLCRPLLASPVVRLSGEHTEHAFFSPADIAGLPMLDGTRGSLNAVFSRWSDPGPWLPGLL